MDGLPVRMARRPISVTCLNISHVDGEDGVKSLLAIHANWSLTGSLRQHSINLGSVLGVSLKVIKGIFLNSY